jgi:membrane protease YdiL (CAAX protease family)
MQAFSISLFLGVVLGFFVPPVQSGLKSWFRKSPRRIFLVPASLGALFAMDLWSTGAWNWAFLGLAVAWMLAPAAAVYANGPGESARQWLDLAAILLLWLPVEFAAGKELIPQRAWGLVNITARGSAITLALALFLVFRDLQGMKYNLPRRRADFLNPVLGYLVLAPVLAFLGLEFGFMGPLRVPEPLAAAGLGLVWLKILVSVALPEELLFRALIQNWIMRNLGFRYASLAAAALVFGAAHLNNPPGPLPNWHYMILASIAGFVFGVVYWKSSSILSSAGLHALVNTTRHVFFG